MCNSSTLPFRGSKIFSLDPTIYIDSNLTKCTGDAVHLTVVISPITARPFVQLCSDSNKMLVPSVVTVAFMVASDDPCMMTPTTGTLAIALTTCVGMHVTNTVTAGWKKLHGPVVKSPTTVSVSPAPSHTFPFWFTWCSSAWYSVTSGSLMVIFVKFVQAPFQSSVVKI